MKRILQVYEEASGQEINLSKSDIMFSRGIADDKGQELAQLLGVQKVAQHDVYLGVPIGRGCSR